MTKTVDRQQARMAFGTALPVLSRAYKAAADKAVGHIGLSQATWLAGRQIRFPGF